MEFSNDPCHSYSSWDGTTVDIDRQTGKILKRYTDAGLVGIDARQGLAKHGLSKGRFMLTNTFPDVPVMQSIRIQRFNRSSCEVPSEPNRVRKFLGGQAEISLQEIITSRHVVCLRSVRVRP